MRALALLLPPLALSGCDALGHSCNLMYAPSFLEIQFEADAWAPGAYEVVLVTDRTLTCAFTLPAGADWTGLCEDEASADSAVSVVTDDSGEGLRAISFFDEAPEIVDVAVYLDGASLLEETVEPDYVEDEPNGEGCGVRESAVVTLTL